jgi:hypothetical protein
MLRLALQDLLCQEVQDVPVASGEGLNEVEVLSLRRRAMPPLRYPGARPGPHRELCQQPLMPLRKQTGREGKSPRVQQHWWIS